MTNPAGVYILIDLIIAAAILTLLLTLFVLYVLSTIGRKGHPDLPKLRGWAYAHRGLHGNGVPENSMQAFRLAKEAGYGIELDIHLLKDGSLAVFHDSPLVRTTGAEGRIEDLTAEDLKNYRLEGTDETIPLFQDVLDLYDGAAPIIVELKEVGNCADLCEAACKMLDEYKGAYCLESFDPRCIGWLRKHRPDLIRGQLTENYFRGSKAKLPWYLKLVLRHQMLNFLTRPDFVAYRFADRKTFSNTLCRKLWGMQGVTWTIKTKADFDTAVAEGWLPIFESFNP